MSLMFIAIPIILVPLVICGFWVYKFHFAVAKSMGSNYEPRLATRHAIENKEIYQIFKKRNFWAVLTLMGFIIGGAIMVGAYIYGNQ